jgi:ribosomal protein S18 acetylase RimI-like enzyme
VSSGPFRVTPLDPSHERSTFDSGSPALDRYFQQQVTQDVRRRITACFVACAADGSVSGFYTLASSSILLSDLPEATSKKLPRYPLVPAVRMGRLAVATTFKGRGLGGAMLADALARASRSDIAAYALVVDAKDESASAFYRHHGLVGFPATELTMFLPLATVKGLV